MLYLMQRYPTSELFRIVQFMTEFQQAIYKSLFHFEDRHQAIMYSIDKYTACHELPQLDQGIEHSPKNLPPHLHQDHSTTHQDPTLTYASPHSDLEHQKFTHQSASDSAQTSLQASFLSTTASITSSTNKRSNPSPDAFSEEQSSFSPDLESYNSVSAHKKHKKLKKQNKNPYPTKNFLPTFRSSIISWLKKHFPQEKFFRIPIIHRIRSKKCINLKDYEQLLNWPQFRPFLETYFKERVIHRDLMLSRVEAKTKRYYFTKIHVFERAFRTGVFQKINY